MAEYARFLTHYIEGVEFNIHGKPFSPKDEFPGDIVHLNHEHNLMAVWNVQAAQSLKALGKKTVLTYHNSRQSGCATPFTQAWDRVVVHEKNVDGFVHIPQGIPVWENTKNIQPQNKIGTAGFPVGHKGFGGMAKIARDLGIGFLLISAKSKWGDATAAKAYVKEVYPQAEVVTDWLSTEQVIERLAECAVVVYLHIWDNPGISASVRLGLATGRPIVLTQNSQFHDLWDDYRDEIYLVDGLDPTYDQVKNTVKLALSDGDRKPKRILEDMNWNRCGQMYKNVYEELMTT